MKKSYLIEYFNGAGVAFPLTEYQIRRECSFFCSTFIHMFQHDNINASCIEQTYAVAVVLQGNVDEDALDSAMHNFLVNVNHMKIEGRRESPSFVVKEMKLVP